MKVNLKHVLTANGAFSLVSGMALILIPGVIAEWMGVLVPRNLQFVGIGLVLFAGTVLHTAFKSPESKAKVRAIIVQDWAWVLGSIIVLAFQAWGLTNLGYWLIAGVAFIVADFAYFQMRLLKRLN